MQSTSYSEFIGIAPRTASLIEAHRMMPDETKDDILFRVLEGVHKAGVAGKLGNAKAAYLARDTFDLGQGATLMVGEKLYLFLSLAAKKAAKPGGIAEVHRDGILIDGCLVGKSRGSVLQPAMVRFQERLNHRNARGEIIALSAWRQWHVHRDGKWIRLIDLKDPDRSRTRRGKQIPFSPDEIGL
jgi:hypothetical protein